ncbi:MAG: YraN family protein [Chloroflexota bacterium]|nr:YraN family protein [Chloroflexota bacterium]
MNNYRKSIGTLGERLAIEHLKKLKYKIIETNFRCSIGEIDIIAQDMDCLVFVEVKTRRSSNTGIPEDALTPQKKHRLRSLALAYLQCHNMSPTNWRLDVVAVELDQDFTPSRIEVIENAI